MTNWIIYLIYLFYLSPPSSGWTSALVDRKKSTRKVIKPINSRLIKKKISNNSKNIHYAFDLALQEKNVWSVIFAKLSILFILAEFSYEVDFSHYFKLSLQIFRKISAFLSTCIQQSAHARPMNQVGPVRSKFRRSSVGLGLDIWPVGRRSH